MPIIHIKSEVEYNKYVSQGKLTVVDFFAEWCGPCKAIAPRFEALSNNFRNANFLKVNIDEMNSLASGLSVSSIPTFIFYKSGKTLHRITGANYNELESTIKKYYTKEGGMPTTGGHVLGSGKTPQAGYRATGEPGSFQQFLSNPPQALIFGIVVVILIFWFTKGKASDEDYARWLKN
ncbi:thioredoxin-domain-containing protein [Neocallimastix lanati (nom. inval.)]|jgi:thioredoxin 1|nr:thioredoxin-domain-containing protein [Neocallimastix sp. JGI-2020a]